MTIEEYYKVNKSLIEDAYQGNVDSARKIYEDIVTAKEVEVNETEIFKWLIFLVNNNDSFGLYSLGCVYYYGSKILGTDYCMAFYYIQKAAELGHIEATILLGAFYESGIGVDIDLNEAYKLYDKASDLGNLVAKSRLAKMCSNIDEFKDYNKAFRLAKEIIEQANLETDDELIDLAKTIVYEVFDEVVETLDL